MNSGATGEAEALKLTDGARIQVVSHGETRVARRN